MTSPRFVPPTLVHALQALQSHHDRGFTFVSSAASERFVAFAELFREGSRMAGALRAQGLQKGDRLVLVVADSDTFVQSFVAAVLAGVVPVPVYPQLSFRNLDGYHDTLAHIARASGAKALLGTEAARPYLEPALPLAPNLAQSLLTVESLADYAGPSLVEQVSPDDLCFLQFTSGSTAKPKGVMVTHGNLAWNAQSFMVHGLGKDSAHDRGVSWLPLFHDMGLIGFVIGPLFTDIQVSFLPTASFVRSPRIWLDVLSRHRGTITYAPNFAYQLVAKRLKDKDLTGLDLSCVRHAGCGAEPISAKTLREFADKVRPAGFDAKAFLPSYGMAEATLAVTFADHRGQPQADGIAYDAGAARGMRVDAVDRAALEQSRAEPAATDAAERDLYELVNCGRVFPDHELKIVDAEGRSLQDRQVGQVLTRGPSVSQGYFEDPDNTREGFKDGWLHTGDLGYLVDGELYLCGRQKDLIIVRGRNFYPSDIEGVVGELPRVRRGNVVAFGVDVDGEEQLVICAEAFQSDAAGLVEEIAQVVNERFQLAVHHVELVPQGGLPRTSSGKPQRRKAKAMLAGEGFARSNPNTADRQAVD